MLQKLRFTKKATDIAKYDPFLGSLQRGNTVTEKNIDVMKYEIIYNQNFVHNRQGTHITKRKRFFNHTF